MVQKKNQKILCIRTLSNHNAELWVAIMDLLHVSSTPKEFNLILKSIKILLQEVKKKQHSGRNTVQRCSKASGFFFFY